MRTFGCILTVASLLLVAACNAGSGTAGTNPSETIPMGPEPGSPAAQTQRGSGSSSAGMPGAY
ncbi:MAG: hypothetical protein ACREQ9_10710 [Candidatus Binatia bacterium]